MMWEYFNNAKRNHYKKANRSKKKICTVLGRLLRAIESAITKNPCLEEDFRDIIALTEHFIAQASGKLVSPSEKIYSPHERTVECIAKGKVGKKYEFGNKVSFVSTDRNNFIVGCVSHHGRPHDSKTLEASLRNVETITGSKPEGYCSVDLGYRGHGIKKREVFVIHPKLKSLKTSEKKLIKRRGKSESVISFVKRKCRMGVNYLSGTTGDIINAISAAVAYNAKLLTREILKKYA